MKKKPYNIEAHAFLMKQGYKWKDHSQWYDVYEGKGVDLFFNPDGSYDGWETGIIDLTDKDVNVEKIIQDMDKKYGIQN
jgi:hypothetical protein